MVRNLRYCTTKFSTIRVKKFYVCIYGVIIYFSYYGIIILRARAHRALYALRSALRAVPGVRVCVRKTRVPVRACVCVCGRVCTRTHRGRGQTNACARVRRCGRRGRRGSDRVEERSAAGRWGKTDRMDVMIKTPLSTPHPPSPHSRSVLFTATPSLPEFGRRRRRRARASGLL